MQEIFTEMCSTSLELLPIQESNFYYDIISLVSNSVSPAPPLRLHGTAVQNVACSSTDETEGMLPMRWIYHSIPGSICSEEIF